MSKLTHSQEAAVHSRDVPVVVSAGAGSGKTTVLVEKYLTLLRSGLNPQQILLVTFTKDAAEELRNRIVARLQAENFGAFTLQQTEDTPYIGTLHSFCYHVVEQWGRACDLPPIEKITDSFQEAEVLGEEFDLWLAGISPEIRESIFQSYSWPDLRVLAIQLYQKRHSLEGKSADFSPFNDIQGWLAPYFANIEKRLLKKGAYSFDDLEHYAVKLLSDIPTALTFYQNQLKRVCVDEFQDTSPSQWRLVQMLVGADSKKLFLVGDPKQSIYRFRQADVGIFIEATQKISDENGDSLTLQDNFRSHPEIIGWINQKSKSLFENSDIPFLELNAAADPGNPLVNVPRVQALRYSEDQEKSAVVDFVQKLTKEIPATDSIGILFRVSDKVSPYALALSAAGFSVTAKRTGRLFETYDILDIYYYFKALKDPSDSLAAASLLRSPYFGLSYEDLHRLTLKSEPLSAVFPAWLKELISQPELSAEKALSELFLHTNYFPENAALFLTWLDASLSEDIPVSALVKKMDYWKFQDIAVPWEENSEGRIKLSTVHGAKGLEYDHVLLVDLLRRGSRQSPWLFVQGNEVGVKYRTEGELTESEVYKKLKEVESERDSQESNRLLYVALTRAKKSLTFFLPEIPELIPKNTWGSLIQEFLT